MRKACATPLNGPLISLFHVDIEAVARAIMPKRARWIIVADDSDEDVNALADKVLSPS